MLKWIGKQFAYVRIYYWLKERLSGLVLTIVLLSLVFYIHSEYLKYLEFKSKNEGDFIGISFIIKNVLVIGIALGYFYFHKTLNQIRQSIKNTQEIIRNENKKSDNEKVKSLDYFLKDEEIDR